MNLYGRKWTRRELESRVGRLQQLAGIRKMKLTEGREADVEQIQVRTGAGLAYFVSPMRGMDISLTEFGGVPLSWQSPNGDVHPSYYDPNGAEWGRTAAGGLLMTCGLTQVGSPCEDGGRKYGQHGRAHHIPAVQTSTESRWVADECTMTVSGIVEESLIFGENLRLRREIVSKIGENKIAIHDVVENAGHESTPHMILYHFNFGFPLMSEKTRISFPEREIVARDKGTPVEGYDRWEPPQANYHERVYYHEPSQPGKKKTSQGEKRAAVSIRNPEFPQAGGMIPVEVRLAWDTENLPRLVQWKMPGLGMHVLGIEPSNCHVEGRVAERERGTLVMLEPGAAATYDLELEIMAG